MIKHKELYQSLKKVSAEWHAGHVQRDYAFDYLKFYEDSTVISCSSNGDLASIEKWFNVENKEAVFSTGKFNLKNNSIIEIKLNAMIGEIEMDGNVFDGFLILRSFNREIRKGEQWDQYTVVL